MVRSKPDDELLVDFGGRDIIPAEEEEEEGQQITPTPLRRASMGGENTREKLSKKLFAVFGRKQSHTPPRSSSDKEGLRRKSLELRTQLDLLKQMNELHLDRRGGKDNRLEARIESLEMAFRMQTSVPEVMNTEGEPDHIYELYGEDSKKPGTFASNCLLARRLVERGVRFGNQAYHFSPR